LDFKCSYTEIVKTSLLKENPDNPNVHTERQIELLAKIIAHQGQRSPIVVSKLSGLIVRGHGRLRAIKKLGWKSCAVDYQHYDSIEDEYRDMVADNKIAELANIDELMVSQTIKTLDLEISDFELLGFDDFIFDTSIESINRGDENSEWAKADLDFETSTDGYIKINLIFASIENRDKYVRDNRLDISRKVNDRQWIAYPDAKAAAEKKKK